MSRFGRRSDEQAGHHSGFGWASLRSLEVGVENQEIRKAGLKVTLPRVKILEILESSESRHMTAEDVYKTLLEHGEEIGLARLEARPIATLCLDAQERWELRQRQIGEGR